MDQASKALIATLSSSHVRRADNQLHASSSVVLGATTAVASLPHHEELRGRPGHAQVLPPTRELDLSLVALVAPLPEKQSLQVVDVARCTRQLK